MRTFAQKPKVTQQTTSAKTTIPGRAYFGQRREVKSIFHSQRTIGNQVVQRMLQTNAGELEVGSASTASPRFAHDFSQIPLHPKSPANVMEKLSIGRHGDVYEEEADRVSEQVIRMPDPQLTEQEITTGQPRISSIQRVCSGCEDEEGIRRQPMEGKEEEEDLLVAKEHPGQAAQVTPGLGSRIQSLWGGSQPPSRSLLNFFEPRFGGDFRHARIPTGQHANMVAGALNAQAFTAGNNEPPEVQAKASVEQSPEEGAVSEAKLHAARYPVRPLVPATRGFFEPRFGRDFSGVQVHTCNDAAGMCKSLNAQAFTYRNNIFFNKGKYEPRTSSGKKLLAHELVHTVQQGVGIAPKSIQRTIGDGHDLESPRYKGDVVLEACYDDERLLMYGHRGPAVAKVQEGIREYFLEREGRDPLPVYGVDGLFGRETKRAVEDFQASEGLTGKHVDGIVGPITMDLLDSEGGWPEPPSPELPSPIPPYKVPKWQIPPKLPGYERPAPSKAKPGQKRCKLMFLSLLACANGPIEMRQTWDDRLGPVCGLNFGRPGAVGVKFEGKIYIFNECKGRLEFLQLVSFCKHRRDTISGSGDWRWRTGGINEYALDSHDPYASKEQKSPTFDGNFIIETSDSPEGTTGFPSDVHIHFRGKYKMFLLWRPENADDSNRVPLALVEWGWKAKADRKNPPPGCKSAWAIRDATPSPGFMWLGFANNIMPKWSKVYPKDYKLTHWERGKC